MEASQHHVPAALSPGNESCTHWTGGWVGSIAGLEILEHKELSCLHQESDRPDRSRVAITDWAAVNQFQHGSSRILVLTEHSDDKMEGIYSDGVLMQ